MRALLLLLFLTPILGVAQDFRFTYLGEPDDIVEKIKLLPQSDTTFQLVAIRPDTTTGWRYPVVYTVPVDSVYARDSLIVPLPGDVELFDAIQLGDTSLVLVGGIRDFGPNGNGQFQALVLHVDIRTGALLWWEHLGGPLYDAATAVAASGDTLLVGLRRETGSQEFRCDMIRYTLAGASLGSVPFSSEDETISRFVPGPDGCVFALSNVDTNSVSFQYSPLALDYDPYVTRLGSNGEVIWRRKISPEEAWSDNLEHITDAHYLPQRGQLLVLVDAGGYSPWVGLLDEVDGSLLRELVLPDHGSTGKMRLWRNSDDKIQLATRHEVVTVDLMAWDSAPESYTSVDFYPHEVDRFTDVLPISTAFLAFIDRSGLSDVVDTSGDPSYPSTGYIGGAPQRRREVGHSFFDAGPNRYFLAAYSGQSLLETRLWTMDTSLSVLNEFRYTLDSQSYFRKLGNMARLGDELLIQSWNGSDSTIAFTILNPDGEEVINWNREAQSFTQTSRVATQDDGSVSIVYSNSSQGQLIILQVDTLGTVVSDHMAHVPGFRGLQDMEVDTDGNLLILSEGIITRRLTLYKVSPAGQLLWQRVLPEAHLYDDGDNSQIFYPYLAGDIATQQRNEEIHYAVSYGITVRDSSLLAFTVLNEEGMVLYEESRRSGEYYQYPNVTFSATGDLLIFSSSEARDGLDPDESPYSILLERIDISGGQVLEVSQFAFPHNITIWNVETAVNGDLLVLGNLTRINSWDVLALRIGTDQTVNVSSLTTVEPIGVVKIYPNPGGTDPFRVAFSSSYRGPVRLRLVDAAGREVYAAFAEKSDTLLTTEVTTDNLPPGTYYLQITAGRHRTALPWVKLR